jgi:hypothetical protein
VVASVVLKALSIYAFVEELSLVLVLICHLYQLAGARSEINVLCPPLHSIVLTIILAMG